MLLHFRVYLVVRCGSYSWSSKLGRSFTLSRSSCLAGSSSELNLKSHAVSEPVKAPPSTSAFTPAGPKRLSDRFTCHVVGCVRRSKYILWFKAKRTHRGQRATETDHLCGSLGSLQTETAPREAHRDHVLLLGEDADEVQCCSLADGVAPDID